MTSFKTREYFETTDEIPADSPYQMDFCLTEYGNFIPSNRDGIRRLDVWRTAFIDDVPNKQRRTEPVNPADLIKAEYQRFTGNWKNPSGRKITIKQERVGDMIIYRTVKGKIVRVFAVTMKPGAVFEFLATIVTPEELGALADVKGGKSDFTAETFKRWQDFKRAQEERAQEERTQEEKEKERQEKEARMFQKWYAQKMNREFLKWRRMKKIRRSRPRESDSVAAFDCSQEVNAPPDLETQQESDSVAAFDCSQEDASEKGKDSNRQKFQIPAPPEIVEKVHAVTPPDLPAAVQEKSRFSFARAGKIKGAR